MNLTKYDVFFKVLETKTISQAAKDLGYSQSAVSQTIKSINVNLKMYSFDHLRMYNIDHINTCCSRW